MKTYVYDGNEVILTGRTALSISKSASGRSIQHRIVEITMKPGIATPKIVKWVKKSDLFVVEEKTIDDLNDLDNLPKP